ncbi:MAG: hypothetical protein JWO56_852 [Acidobacteria bacterium]|nr:hypothetical protein [Acidobacteriota bacterium]
MPQTVPARARLTTRRLLLFLLVVLLPGVACRREPARIATPAAPAAASSSSAEFESLPARDAYAGSASCRECHAKNYERWQHDFHAKALAPAEGKNVAGRFEHAHFRGASSEAWMSRGPAGRYVMRTRNREGRLADYPVSWVIGAKRMQDTVTIFDDGRWQVLPVYFHITGGGAWVDYNAAKQGAVAPDHPYYWTNFRRTANKECLECHATGLEVHYDARTHAWSTAFADPGVACEACHGPGARHADTKAKSDIVRADHLDKELALSICARCHGPRDPLFPLLDAKDQFRPGQRYGDKYQPLVVTDGTERSGEFFADGRPSSSSFEYQALLQSRCYRIGGATCLTCHDAPHGSPENVDRAANELRHADPNASCTKCHAAMPPDHSHHPRAQAGCVDCHMPKVLSGVLDKFADHSIDVPNLDGTLRHGVPNACAVCHADRKPEALAQDVARWWPAASQRTARRSRLADAIDEKTNSRSFAALEAVVRDAAEAPTLRGACADLLGQRFPQAAAPVLVSVLHDRDAVVRAKAVEALGYANARDAADAVATLTADDSLQVRQLAAMVLATWNDPRGQAAIAKLANDPATRPLVRPHIVLGVAAAQRGDFDTATRELGFAVAEAPYAVDALVMLADIQARRGDLAAARAYLDEALRFNPQHAGAKGRLAAMTR